MHLTSSSGQTAYVIDASKISFALSLMDPISNAFESVPLKNEYGPWLQWKVQHNGSSWQASPLATNVGVGVELQPTGSIGVQGMQIKNDTNHVDNYHFKINATSTEGYSKTFNVYLQSENGNIINQAIDGGATITNNMNNLTINLVANSFNQVSPDSMILLTSVNNPPLGTQNNPNFPFKGIPAAPVIGELTIPTKPITFKIIDKENQNSTTPTTIIKTDSNKNLVFGWTGLNPKANISWSGNSIQNGWISTYTNKVGPKNIVEIKLTNSQKSGVNYYIFTQADLDGMWMTGIPINDAATLALIKKFQPQFQTGVATNIGAGTYQITMRDLAIVNGKLTPISRQSAPLTLEVTFKK